jgi:hypothetical protein
MKVRWFAAAAAPLMLAGLLSTAGAAQAQVTNGCRAHGLLASCSYGLHLTRPLHIHVHGRATPRQRERIAWALRCEKGTRTSARHFGSVSAVTPIRFTVAHPYKRPDSCQMKVRVSIDTHGHIRSWVTYSQWTPGARKG